MLKGFRDFILRGNVIELAVAVVIGAAFNEIVTKIVKAVFNPLISSIFQADSLDNALTVTMPGGAALQFGAVIGATINFLLVAAVVYFVFVVPMNKFKARQAAKAVTTPEPAPIEQQLLTEIRDLLAQQQNK